VLSYRELLRNLVLRNLKLKYRGSVFGFLWSLVNPLLMIVVYSAAFSIILRVRTPGFVFLLLLGVLAWTFFANSASMSTGAIVDSGGLVKSAVFPRAILPTATVLFNLAQYLLNVLVFLPVMLVAYGVLPVPAMGLFPVFLALQVAFTVGVALILSTGTVFFRDIRHILEIALGVLFWTTPIVYTIRDLPELVRTLVILSPLSPFVVAYHQIFYERHSPDPAVWFLAVLYAAAALSCGLRLFVSLEDRFAEQM
jgi:ABC-type polysaccharide/polyol phosphate export permease